MASTHNPSSSSIDPKSGFWSKTNIYHSIRPPVPLPPIAAPISLTQFTFSVLHSFPPPPTSAALVDAVTKRSISFPELILRSNSLASSLHHRLGLTKGDTAFILSPNSLNVPILYFALFSFGVVISPANPLSTKPEILYQIQLSKPVIAFATSDTVQKLPGSLKTILLDSPEFESLMSDQYRELGPVTVYEADPAAILYSSGTTGRVKGVLLTQRNFIAAVAFGRALGAPRKTPAVGG